MPENLTTVRNPNDLVEIGKSVGMKDIGLFKDWLPLNIRRTMDNPAVLDLIYQAVGLKYVLDSLAVSAYTATNAGDAEQYKMTALTYKDAYAPFMKTSLYKGIARYYSGQAPASKKGFKKVMTDLYDPATIYSRRNLAGYLRTPIGSSYLGRVGDRTYRAYDKITEKGRDRLLALRKRGEQFFGKIPAIPEAYREYMAARAGAREAALEKYARTHPKNYTKTLNRILARRDAGWIPPAPVRSSEEDEDFQLLPGGTPGSGGPETGTGME